MNKIKEITLGADHSFSIDHAEQRGLYVETEDGVTHITGEHIFPDVAKPAPIEFSDLLHMPTPPTPIGSAGMCIVKFHDDFLPIAAYRGSRDERLKYSRSMGATLTRVTRQSAIDNTLDVVNARMSETFRLWALGIAVTGILAMILIILMVVLRGGPDPVQ